jgi:hypothetical protein
VVGRDGGAARRGECGVCVCGGGCMEGSGVLVGRECCVLCVVCVYGPVAKARGERLSAAASGCP